MLRHETKLFLMKKNHMLQCMGSRLNANNCTEELYQTHIQLYMRGTSYYELQNWFTQVKQHMEHKNVQKKIIIRIPNSRHNVDRPVH